MRLPRLHRPRPVVWLAIAIVALAVLVVVQPGAVFAQPPQPPEVPSILSPKSASTEIIAQLFTFITWLAVGVFVLVEGLIVYSVVRFRRKPGDTSEPVRCTVIHSLRSPGRLCQPCWLPLFWRCRFKQCPLFTMCLAPRWQASPILACAMWAAFRPTRRCKLLAPTS